MEQLAIGKLAKTFGVNGWLRVLSYSGESAHFRRLKTVEARDGTRQLVLEPEGIKAQPDGLVIKFRGYDTPEQARVLCGLELVVPRDQAAPLKPGEYYFADLCGCSLVHDQAVCGEVRGVLEGGAAGVLLEIERGNQSTVLIPFQEPFIGAVDIQRKVIELRTPWVLE